MDDEIRTSVDPPMEAYVCFVVCFSNLFLFKGSEDERV